jgi:hypothetical protein
MAALLLWQTDRGHSAQGLRVPFLFTEKKTKKRFFRVMFTCTEGYLYAWIFLISAKGTSLGCCLCQFCTV